MKTKKYLVLSILFLGVISFGLFGGTVLPAEAAATKKVVVAKSAVTWAASGIKELTKIRNTSVRKAYKTKVEKYAIRNKIKTITSAVVKGMRE